MVEVITAKRGIEILAEGGVCITPTESVFGFAACVGVTAGLVEIMQRKQRGCDLGFIVIVADPAQVSGWFVEDIYRRWQDYLARLHGDPNISTVLPLGGDNSFWLNAMRVDEYGFGLLTGGRRSCAVRVTRHLVLRELCLELGPLVSTSANTHGFGPYFSVSDLVTDKVSGGVPLVAGELGGRERPSALFDLLDGSWLRT